MDRINIKCAIAGLEQDLQLAKKAMPGGTGPCFMFKTDGSFRGYISRQKNGSYQSIGSPYYTAQELQVIAEQLRKHE